MRMKAGILFPLWREAGYLAVLVYRSVCGGRVRTRGGPPRSCTDTESDAEVGVGVRASCLADVGDHGRDVALVCPHPPPGGDDDRVPLTSMVCTRWNLQRMQHIVAM